jgi:predicted signal transduction protein with EAL and GGDEF domain
MGTALQQFVTIPLPIMVTLVVTIWLASWIQNRRIDELSNRWGDQGTDLNKRFDDLRSDMNARFTEVNRRMDVVIVRLDRIEAKLDSHEERIVRLEERTSPLRG